MSTIYGSIFIVPNRASTLEGWPSSTRNSFRKSLSNLGLKPDGKLVQVWYVSDQCDNWTSHLWLENPEFFEGLPNRLPEHLLEGVKEGDEVVLTFGEKELRLTAAQKNYRYRRAGTFEETFEQVTS
jgi:hypothetical protein